MIAAALIQIILLGAPGELDELEAMQLAVRAAVDKVSPSVVTILTTGGIRNVKIPERFKEKMSTPERPRGGRRPLPEEDEEEPAPEGRTPRFKNEWLNMLAAPGFKKAEGPCTGVIVSADGYIVTSAWNFESDPNSIVVSLANGSSYAAKLLGIDRAASLALLKIKAEGLSVPEFIDPKEVKVGRWAFAIGRAMSTKHPEVKYGVISARDRIEGNALQTDAATSPTNYGGPLIDVEGRIYGIIVPLGSRGQETNPNWYDSGIGFAAPIQDAKALVARLGKEGTVLKPAFLGVQMDQDRTGTGAKVTSVVPESGAHKAGLKPGDLVLTIDGELIKNSFTLRFAVGRKRAGEKIMIEVQRADKKITMEVKLGERPKLQTAKDKIPVPMPGPRGKPRKRDRRGGDDR